MISDWILKLIITEVLHVVANEALKRLGKNGN